MKTHELAKLLLSAPNGDVIISLDMPDNGKVFGYGLIDVTLPSKFGFGSDECILLFEEGVYNGN